MRFVIFFLFPPPPPGKTLLLISGIGMFLFATLVMENLKMCTTREEFEEEMELSVFPRKLEDA